jgi:hypothetical protein
MCHWGDCELWSFKLDIKWRKILNLRTLNRDSPVCVCVYMPMPSVHWQWKFKPWNDVQFSWVIFASPPPEWCEWPPFCLTVPRSACEE